MKTTSMMKTKKKTLTVLIDGDIFIYQAAAASEHAVQWDSDLWTLHSNLSEAAQFFEDKLSSALTSIQENEALCGDLQTKVIIALSDQTGHNFRKDIWPEYKANRKTKRSPLVRSALYNYVVENYATYIRPCLEADDVLGILQTSPYIIKGPRIVVSSDKDFKTIPGTHYNMDKKEFFEVSVEEAAFWHLIQALTGDAADGYPGCPGVGPKKAEALMLKVKESLPVEVNPAEAVYRLGWPVVLGTYEKAGLGPEYALTMARLARICQRNDYDFKKREVIAWNPPEPNVPVNQQ